MLTCVGVGVAAGRLQASGAYSTQLSVPFLKRLHPDLVIDSLLDHRLTSGRWPIVPFLMFLVLVIVGLLERRESHRRARRAGDRCVLVSSAALTVLTYLSSNARFAEYLDIQQIPDVGELTIFCGSLVGASLGFLWYNAHPAEMFMGDVARWRWAARSAWSPWSSSRKSCCFRSAAFLCWKLLSVIMQVGSFKLTGKRVFRMSPLHHHFELMGWSESKIIVRFWIVALVFALFSLTTLKLR